MGKVRPFSREDAWGVAQLQELVARSGRSDPPPGLAAYITSTYLEHPWADEDIPSWVYESDDGRIVGFLGAHVRRLTFDGRPLRAAYAGQFVTHPEVRSQPVGALLVRRFLQSPQDVSLTDAGSPPVRRMWEGMGGRVLEGHSISWLCPLRPWQMLARLVSRKLGASGAPRSVLSACSALDALTARVPATRLRIRPPEVVDEPLTVVDLLAHRKAVAGARIHPAYDAEFLAWVFSHLESLSTRGPLVRRLIHDRGTVLGWWVAFLPAGRMGQALDIAATSRGAPAVVDHLLHTASEAGVLSMTGRLEPHLFEAMAGRPCLLRPAARMLVHARDADIADAIMAGHARLTRLDGEWWMGHWTEPFRQDPPMTAMMALAR